ncbi:MAG TPA: MFS transporter [Ilumatobacteraceae bacterium]|nr:MFS transporter [Ilumatobacteraceae bacterium]
MSATSASLRAEPTFVRWASAEGVSMLGTAVSSVVLPLVVYQTTGSAAQTGALFALRVVPYLVFGLVAGPVADRGDRRRLIIGGNLVEGTLVATIPIAHLLGVLTIGQIYVVALLAATAFVFSDAAVFGAVPALVGPERLAAANGFLSTLSAGSEIVGPVIAGALVAAIGATNAIWIDAASFFAAAAVQSTIRSSFREPRDASAVAEGIRATLRRASRFIRSDRTVATLLLAGFGNSFAFGTVIGLLVPYAVEEIGVPADDGRIGLLYGALGVGSLAAGLLFARVFRPGRIKVLTPGALVLAGGLVAVLAANTRWVTALIAIALFAWAIMTAVIVGITYRQLAAPDDLRSSVNVIGRMIAWGGQPFGAAAGAAISATADVPTAYSVAAVIMLVSGVGAAIALRTADGGRSAAAAYERRLDGRVADVRDAGQ